MHADLSRITFRPDRHYSAVVAQQGRVQLDADANEQTAIQLHQLRTLASDLIGRHGGPAGDTGFRVKFVGGHHEVDTLLIGGGRYYVDGILCDASRPRPGTPVPDEADGGDGTGTDGAQDETDTPESWTYWDQPDGFRSPERPEDRLPSTFPFMAYLKVWERSVTAAEDPALREVALGSAMPDTAARTKVVWQVLALDGRRLEVEDDQDKDAIRAAFRKWADRQGAASRLAARSRRPEHTDEEPCVVTPDARYRGPENQLYRVEVHEGGPAEEATFTWSRENGSVTFPVDAVDGTWVELASPGADDKLDLDAGDWVEFLDTAVISRGEPLPLLRVEELDLPGRRVRLSAEPEPGVGRHPDRHPFLRRWDQYAGPRRSERGPAPRLRRGAVRVEEGRWLPLEDGVEIYFEADGVYRTGDFWLIPARTATGAVEWPADAARRPLLQGPAGIEVRYAPLSWVTGEQASLDLRMSFGPLAAQVPAATEEERALEARVEREEEAARRAAAAAEKRAAAEPAPRPQQSPRD